MSDILVARRYAEALYDFAKASGTVAEVDQDVSSLGAALEESRELVNFFASPIISREKKAQVVRSLFEGRLSSTALRFLSQLVDKRRENILADILAAYQTLRDGQLGVARAVARSASTLAEDERANVQTALERLSGMKIRLQSETDESLIGGVVVRIGDTVYDGSLRNKLNHLKDQFMSGSFRTN